MGHDRIALRRADGVENDPPMKTAANRMIKPNALLSALHMYVESCEDGRVIGRCREFPEVVICGEAGSTEETTERLRQEVTRLLESGAAPAFYGVGEWVFSCCLHNPNTEQSKLFYITDIWCGLPEPALQEQARKAAEEWIVNAGPRISQKRRIVTVTCDSLTKRICKAVKVGRKKFDQDKALWQEKWKAATLKREQELQQESLIKQQIDMLVDEALRYVELGGRLKVPWALRGRRATAADTWFLMSAEEFDRRARQPEARRVEKKNADGTVTGGSIIYENAGGGEMMAVGEQTEFMLGGLAKFAEEGDEDALRWLHRLALRAASFFWSSVELQSELAQRISKEWFQVPVATNGSAASAKAAEARVRALDMPKPPESDLKVNPTTRHHAFICRIGSAINFLMNTPPASFPWTGVDEHAPEWLKTAWEASQAQPQKVELLPEIYWLVYKAAMTRTPQSKWRKLSRPKKVREKFLKAANARLQSKKASGRTP